MFVFLRQFILPHQTPLFFFFVLEIEYFLSEFFLFCDCSCLFFLLVDIAFYFADISLRGAFLGVGPLILKQYQRAAGSKLFSKRANWTVRPVNPV